MNEIEEDPVVELLAEDFNQFANETSWRPGQSGNPLGRPVVPEDIDDVLRSIVKGNTARAIARSLVDLALSGNFQAIQYTFDRLKGKPRQALESRISVEHPLALLLNEALYGESEEGVPALSAGATGAKAKVRKAPRKALGPPLPR